MERCLPSLAWHLEEPELVSYPNFYAAKLPVNLLKSYYQVLEESFSLVIHGDISAMVKNFEDYIDKYTFTGRDWLAIPILKSFFTHS